MIKLLEVPTLQIEERIKKELEENPALEEGQEEDDIQPEGEEKNSLMRTIRIRKNSPSMIILRRMIFLITGCRQKTTAKMKRKELKYLFQ